MTITPDQAPSPLDTDVAIVGGGIAGLWSRATLHRAGFSVTLLDAAPLGAGQSIASQGILHRGVKYAFSAQARHAADELHAAADAWRDALAGRGPVDLRAVRVLSDCTHLWTPGGVFSALTAWSASKALVSGVRELDRPAFPHGFEHAPATVRVWRVDEPVVDPASLLHHVRDAAAGPQLAVDPASIIITPRDDHATLTAHTRDGHALALRARRVVLAAGVGNAELLARAGLDADRHTQRRPLHMALMRQAPFPLFAHCPQPGSDKPRLTITTSAPGHAPLVWYIGGQVAERGVELSPSALIDLTRRELAACLPWVDLADARWATLRVDRAEARTDAGTRPDGAVVRRFGPLIAVWPTKLALAPVAARRVLDLIDLAPTPPNTPKPPASSPIPIAPLPWDDPSTPWT